MKFCLIKQIRTKRSKIGGTNGDSFVGQVCTTQALGPVFLNPRTPIKKRSGMVIWVVLAALGRKREQVPHGLLAGLLVCLVSYKPTRETLF